MTDPSVSGPLVGALVVDLSRALAGPRATMMLADMGARVIKVETPGTGDDSRQWGILQWLDEGLDEGLDDGPDERSGR